MEITPTEAAKATGYSIGHIRWLVRNGKIKARRVGERMLLIDKASVLQYTKDMAQQGTQKHDPRR